MSLEAEIRDHIESGCHDVSRSLGIQKMPPGYALMLNADGSHFYWLREDGSESVIHWDKWAIYRWAMAQWRENDLDSRVALLRYSE